ncbi:MAG TPA: toll/interleukin-1 receptor domain-containing protein [Pyrinomonadaceae bacterium]|jgi:hypothetical protein
MADIFLSYSKVDQLRIEPIVEALEHKGYSVWWDREISPGAHWSRAIEEELDDAKCVVVVWSKTSVLSDWVEIEAARARKRGVLVPILIDDVAEDIPLEFSRIEAARLVEWERNKSSPEFEELLEVIDRKIHSGQTDEARRRKTRRERIPQDVAGKSARAEGKSFIRRRRKPLLLGAAVAGLVLTTGIVYYASLPTNQEILDRYAPQIDDKIKQLREIAKSLPPKGAVRTTQCARPIDPRPIYDRRQEVFNTEIMMEPDLRRESEKYKDSDKGFKLYLGNSLYYLISYRLGSWGSGVGGQKAESDAAQSYERGLSTRYLVVNRVVNYQAPYVTGERSFFRGKVEMEVFLIDLQSSKIICSFPLSAEADENLYAPASDYEKAAASNLYERTEKNLEQALADGTGGLFHFDR